MNLCVQQIQKTWEDYEFDFTNVPLHLKFKVLLYLQQQHPIPLTESDLYCIFTEECDSVISEVHLIF